MNDKPLDIIAIGRGCVDLVLKVDRLPGYDQKVIGTLVGWQPGGTVANFACAASRLGLRTGFLGTVGDDAHAGAVRADFAHWGVQTDRLATRRGEPTYFTVVVVPSNGEKCVIVVPTYDNPLSLDDDARAYLATARAVYSMPYDRAQLREIAALVRGAGGKMALDIENALATRGDALLDVLCLADIAFLNGEALVSATGARDPRAARALLAHGPQAIVVTLGADGSHVFTREGEAANPGFRVPVVDTTGAGDCFNAAFLRGYLSGGDLHRCLRFANAAAALSITRLGPRGLIPTVKEVEAFLATRE